MVYKCDFLFRPYGRCLKYKRRAAGNYPFMWRSKMPTLVLFLGVIAGFLLVMF